MEYFPQVKKSEIDIHIFVEMLGDYLQYKASTAYLQQYSSINQEICKRTYSAPEAFIPLQVKGQFVKAQGNVLTTFVCKYEEVAIQPRDMCSVDIPTSEGNLLISTQD